jgi:hypothetical protein
MSCAGAASAPGGGSNGSLGGNSGSGGDEGSSTGGQGGAGASPGGAGGTAGSAGGTSGSTGGGSGGAGSGGTALDAGPSVVPDASGTGGMVANDASVATPDSANSTSGAGGAGGADPQTVGWTAYNPPKFVQIETHDLTTHYDYTGTSYSSEGGSYDRSNGIETFKLFNNDASNRVEVRVMDDYATGLRQFVGDVRFTAPTDDESMMQVFGETGGSSMLMLKGYAANGGTIAKEGGHAVLVTGVYNTWVHVNVIHDATNNKVAVYINGQLKGNFGGKGVGPDRPFHYHKYGCYGTLMTATAQVEWRNVSYWMK